MKINKNASIFSMIVLDTCKHIKKKIIFDIYACIQLNFLII